jgi:hypothetical protein
MPKVGDLHSHTSGAVTPESKIAWGAADGACIDTTTFVASSGPRADGAVPIADALEDQALYDSNDQGILRIDITHEYVRAVEEQGLTYPQIKKIARTSLEHAFLAGKSLWKTRDDFSALVDECASDSPGETPSSACDAFLQGNDKARIQWRHESATSAFEASIVSP